MSSRFLRQPQHGLLSTPPLPKDGQQSPRHAAVCQPGEQTSRCQKAWLHVQQRCQWLLPSPFAQRRIPQQCKPQPAVQDLSCAAAHSAAPALTSAGLWAPLEHHSLQTAAEDRDGRDLKIISHTAATTPGLWAARGGCTAVH